MPACLHYRFGACFRQARRTARTNSALCYDSLLAALIPYSLEESLILFRTGLVCLLTVGIALGQTKSSTPATHAPTPALKPRASSPAPESKSATEPPSTSADSPVITVEGLCERPAGSSATPSDCRTVITRAQFEKVVNAVRPNMPPASKKQFAGRYVTVLILAEK